MRPPDEFNDEGPTLDEIADQLLYLNAELVGFRQEFRRLMGRVFEILGGHESKIPRLDDFRRLKGDK